ncbi:hypothetical protein QCM77_18935 [Bradyrhizobium sp. SSUT18]|uniref:hypothetical protein n=1 Tax=Bradyrhizobium sp. SSUT18 TaxID=3040602 RepID=UPI00244BBE2B|nr:hypothetical protein [Bradyrhizobium sp. SSUT18]MDH2402018.1 hypothetical protein [Bradyrhizobium sp. SSUT18]
MVEAQSKKSEHPPRRYTDQLKLRVQPALTKALDLAAASQFTTPSEYVRRSLVDRLRADGVDLQQFARAV